MTPEFMKSFNSLIIVLRKLNLPAHEYAIFGSGPLAVRGLRDANDLDIIVKPALWKKLSARYQVEDKKAIHLGGVDIFCDWKPWIDDSNNLIDNAEIIDGLPYVRIEYVLEWKKLRGSDKDKKDIELIEKFLAKKIK